MSWIALGDPVPRSNLQPFDEPVWPNGHRTSFPEALARDYLPFDKVVSHRRTRYQLGAVTLEEIGIFFSLTCRVHHSSVETALGFPLSRRPLPSAGAIHPIHVMVNRFLSSSWERYDPFEHALVEVGSTLSPKGVRSMLDEIVPTAEATVLLLAAEPQRTAAKYFNESSLVWRDAGVLIGGMSLASEALDLSFVPLGITGERWTASLVPNRALAGVGCGLLGARDSN